MQRVLRKKQKTHRIEQQNNLFLLKVNVTLKSTSETSVKVSQSGTSVSVPAVVRVLHNVLPYNDFSCLLVDRLKPI